MMEERMKGPRRKREREDKPNYLLTSRKTWVPESVLHPSSQTLVATYLHLAKNVKKEEDVDGIIADAQPIGVVNLGDPPSIKAEDDVEKENETNLSSLLGKKNLPVVTEETCLGEEGMRGDKNKSMIPESSGNVSISSAKNRGIIKRVNGVIQFECDFCGKMFKFLWDYNNHLKTHSKKKYFECESCGMSYMRQQNLNKHIRTKHVFSTTNKEFKCEMCPNSYTSRHYFESHMRKHWREEYENKIRSQGVQLAEACVPKGQTLNGDKKIRCERCGMEFEDGGWLMQHQKRECYYTALEALRTNKLGVYKGDGH